MFVNTASSRTSVCRQRHLEVESSTVRSRASTLHSARSFLPNHAEPCASTPSAEHTPPLPRPVVSSAVSLVMTSSPSVQQQLHLISMCSY